MSGAPRSRDEAIGFLLERGMFGIEPGTGTMTELLAALGDPQLSFAKLHVVGTNGKSSTARFAAHLAAAAGRVAGAYVSPHLTGFEQRVLLPGSGGAPEEATSELFVDSLGEVIERALELESAGDRQRSVTQFELVTATAFLMMQRAGVEVGVVEAGMGGRLDATNVLGSGVVALTSIGLDHQQWLGDDLASIAREKLAVVRQGDMLAVAPGLPDEVRAAVEEAAERSGRDAVIAPGDPGEAVELAALGSFQRCNLALAIESVAALVGRPDIRDVEAVADRVTVPGRLELVERAPDTFVDSAHNVEGVAALVGELGSLADGRRTVFVVAVLADKDASGMIALMQPLADAVVTTRPEVERALDAGDLAGIARSVGVEAVEAVTDPRAAVERARSLAGPDGVVVCAGSIQLAGEILSEPGSRQVTGL